MGWETKMFVHNNVLFIYMIDRFRADIYRFQANGWALVKSLKVGESYTYENGDVSTYEPIPQNAQVYVSPWPYL